MEQKLPIMFHGKSALETLSSDLHKSSFGEGIHDRESPMTWERGILREGSVNLQVVLVAFAQALVFYCYIKWT